MNDLQYIENKTFDEISVGDSAEISRTLKSEDISLFAVTSGDVNSVHLDTEYANASQFHEVIAHGMWGGALISAVLGTELPGPGTIYVKQSLSFRKPVGVGDTERQALHAGAFLCCDWREDACRLEPIENPFGKKSVAYVSGIKCNPCAWNGPASDPATNGSPS